MYNYNILQSECLFLLPDPGTVMDTGVKGWRSYKDKLKLRTKPRMQTDLLNTEMSKYVKNHKPDPLEPKQIEGGKVGEEGKIVEILKSDVIDKDSGQYSSVKYIQQILDEVFTSVVNLATDETEINQKETKLVEAKEVECGDLVNNKNRSVFILTFELSCQLAIRLLTILTIESAKSRDSSNVVCGC